MGITPMNILTAITYVMARGSLLVFILDKMIDTMEPKNDEEKRVKDVWQDVFNASRINKRVYFEVLMAVSVVGTFVIAFIIMSKIGTVNKGGMKNDKQINKFYRK